MKLLRLVVALACVACGDSKPDERREAPSTKSIDVTQPTTAAPPAPAPTPSPPPAEQPAAPTGSATAAADFPAECNDYRAVVDKMNACDKFGSQKQQLADTFAKSWEAWSKLPADGRASLATSCKTAADSIRKIGAGACGW